MRFHQKVLAVLFIGSLAPSVLPWSASADELPIKMGSLMTAGAMVNPTLNFQRSSTTRYEVAAAKVPNDPQPDKGNGPPDEGSLPCKADPDKNPKCGEIKTKSKPSDNNGKGNN